MIKVKGVSDAKIKAQGVELGDWPDRVEAQARGNNKIILRVNFGVVNVVVVFGANSRTDSKPDRAQEQIVGNARDIFLPGLGRCLSGQ